MFLVSVRITLHYLIGMLVIIFVLQF